MDDAQRVAAGQVGAMRGERVVVHWLAVGVISYLVVAVGYSWLGFGIAVGCYAVAVTVGSFIGRRLVCRGVITHDVEIPA